jgi:hypothetical protein
MFQEIDENIKIDMYGKKKSNKNGVFIKLFNVLVQEKIYTPPQVSSFLKDDFILYCFFSFFCFSYYQIKILIFSSCF